MVRHNLAARSLRHLRFARRMLAGQPLLARVTDGHHSPMYNTHTAYISLDGYQLPIGRILRHLPLHDVSGIVSDVPVSDATTVSETMLPTETVLRLVPRLPELDTLSATDAVRLDDSPASSSQAPRQATDGPRQPPAVDERPPAPLLAHPDGRRPRSRIVELPGIVSLPVEDEASAEPDETGEQREGVGDAPSAAQDDTQPHTGAETLDEGTSDTPVEEPVAQMPEQTAAIPSVPASSEPAPMPSESPPAPPQRRRGKRGTPPPPRAADALFPPTDADRSPQTWLARLRGEKPTPSDSETQSSVEPPTTPDKSALERPRGKGRQPSRSTSVTTPQPSTPPSVPMVQPSTPSTTSKSVERPTTLPESSRTLLHTLTGVDPVSVRIYRGPVAERATSAQNADALTDGGTIALGTGHATDTPETLGLIAHELTHVAHRRNPRFVPPITQALPGQPRGHATPRVSQPHSAISLADQESQAGLVESRVAHIARARVIPPVVQPALPEPVVPTPATPPRVGEQPQQVETRPVWGNLPAPWEPLPDWLASPANPAHPASPASAQTTAVQQQPGHAVPSARPSSGNAPGTQRAEHGRTLPAMESESSHATHGHEGGTPEPDLDALAQQVHAILKRRLAAERRRFG